jgi:hypothetical protein
MLPNESPKPDSLSPEAIASIDRLSTLLADLNLIELPAAVSEAPPAGPPIAPDEITDDAALAQLQSLLIDPRLHQVNYQLDALQQQIVQVDEQLQAPHQLSDRLVPLVSEALCQKVQQSHTDVVQAIAIARATGIRDRILQQGVASSLLALDTATTPPNVQAGTPDWQYRTVIVQLVDAAP